MFWLLIFLACFVQAEDPWKRVGEVLEHQPFFDAVAVTVGNTSRIYSHVKGNMTLQQDIPIASATKMVSSTLFFQLIEQGKLSLDDYVKDYVEWWTRDENDTRSLIQVRHCLTFTTGYNFGLGTSDKCLMDDYLVDCVRKKYEKYEHSTIPGTMWDYNEFHLQIVAVIAVNVTKTSISELLKEHLGSMNMTKSYYKDASNPDVSGDLVSTGDDYEQFMLRFWRGDVVNATSKSLILSDSTENIEVSNASWYLRVSTGSYGMTCYYECPFWLYRGYPKFPERCKDLNIHSDPGAYGWWPLYDLKNNYFFQIVAYGPLSIGVAYGFYIRLIIKPFIDRAIRGEKQPPLESIDWNAWNLVKEASDPLEALFSANKIVDGY